MTIPPPSNDHDDNNITNMSDSSLSNSTSVDGLDDTSSQISLLPHHLSNSSSMMSIADSSPSPLLFSPNFGDNQANTTVNVDSLKPTCEKSENNNNKDTHLSLSDNHNEMTGQQPTTTTTPIKEEIIRLDIGQELLSPITTSSSTTNNNNNEAVMIDMTMVDAINEASSNNNHNNPSSTIVGELDMDSVLSHPKLLHQLMHQQHQTNNTPSISPLLTSSPRNNNNNNNSNIHNNSMDGSGENNQTKQQKSELTKAASLKNLLTTKGGETRRMSSPSSFSMHSSSNSNSNSSNDIYNKKHHGDGNGENDNNNDNDDDEGENDEVNRMKHYSMTPHQQMEGVIASGDGSDQQLDAIISAAEEKLQRSLPRTSSLLKTRHNITLPSEDNRRKRRFQQLFHAQFLRKAERRNSEASNHTAINGDNYQASVNDLEKQTPMTATSTIMDDSSPLALQKRGGKCSLLMQNVAQRVNKVVKQIRYVCVGEPAKKLYDLGDFDLKSVKVMIIDLVYALICFGMPIYRVDTHLKEICMTYGVSCYLDATNSGFLITFADSYDREDIDTRYIRITSGCWDLNKLCELDDVAYEIASNRINVADAQKKIKNIISATPIFASNLFTLFSYTVCAACFAIFLSCRWQEVLVASIAGFAVAVCDIVIGAYLPTLAPIGSVVDALVSGMLALAFKGIFNTYGYQMQVTIVGICGVVIPLPGLSITTAIQEVTSKQVRSGCLRFVNAFFCSIQLAAGLMISRMIEKEIPFKDVPVVPFVYPNWAMALIIPCAAIGFMISLRAPQYLLATLFVIANCFIAYFLPAKLSTVLRPELGAFIGAFCVQSVSKVYGWISKHPPSVVTSCSILLMVPGSVSVRGLNALIDSDLTQGATLILLMFQIALGLALGLILANFCFSWIGHRGGASFELLPKRLQYLRRTKSTGNSKQI